ncbi:MAG: AI-2E family transporter [Anaerolineae bacterium]
MAEISTTTRTTSPAWTGRTKRTVVLIALVLIGLLLWQIAGALTLVIIALVISFLLYPLATFLERRVTRRLPGARSWAILLTYILVFLLVVLLILIILPAVFRQINLFAEQLPAQLTNLQTQLEETLSRPLVINGQTVYFEGRPLIPLEQITAVLGQNPGEALTSQNFDLVGTLRGIFSSISAPTFRIVGGIFSLLINVVLLLTMMFYLLKDGAKFVTSAIGLVPGEYQSDARRIFMELRGVWNAYLRGQLILSTFMGTVVFLCASVLGIPNAPVLGLISFTLEFVPTLGPILALVPASLLALTSTSTTIPGLSGIGFALVVIVVWTMLQNIEAIFVTPRVMGGSLDLHPIIVIIGVLAGAQFGGALGVILAAPTIASIRVVAGYAYNKLLDRPAFKDMPEEPGIDPKGRWKFNLFGPSSPASQTIDTSPNAEVGMVKSASITASNTQEQTSDDSAAE